MDLFEKHQLYCATTTQLFPDFVVLGGRGCYVRGQIEGQEPRWFLDFAADVGASPLGHTPPAVSRAIRATLRKGIVTVHNDWPIEEAILLAERLVNLTPGSFPKKVFFCNSGAEAVGAAVKIGFDARPGKTTLLAPQKAFNGRLGYAQDLTNSKLVQTEGFPVGAKVLRLPFPDAHDPNYSYADWRRSVEMSFLIWDKQALPVSGEISSFVYELVQGEGGIRVADLRAIEFLASYLRDRGILLVVDEIQTGIDRTGKFLASEHYGIEPDMVCLSKALAGGIAIGAVVFRADLDFKRQGRHSGTFAGGSIPCAAALAVLDVVTEPKFLEGVGNKAELLTRELYGAVKALSGNSRSVAVSTCGLGLMHKIEFRGKDGEPLPVLINKIERRCLENGLRVVHAGDSAIRFLPPLVISPQQIKSGVAIFTRSVLEVLA
ncbi:hypothetical protein A2797_02830 [candidate division WWE3 bacterium RIFCSPHIGHO2_01_FULL_48_15]|uniref:Acetylornithine aminotransferase n=1 Tax=candidate division WWE3 bacterium RIFCSPHIGHO2_01_FULL_48_15 TaxID=1802619 RepID=A0A1F4VCJ9_UNCKA|nr:MAG: hypothetical protein A2797_02830 [candidate division WWE3 bacterium RIFCSPHIGHO2_01_FULL_48_15]